MLKIRRWLNDLPLRDALSGTQAREQELNLLRASLEATVAERTISLQPGRPHDSKII
jgi:hypothetical protein